ncbi:hypothetical protein [Edaphobacter sp. 12200R-103]|uniref:hypothetical protein n=1 Tax=Edaphobacter sp. 12200R-103 TaxID=2703788 RepID=UPI00138C81A7|nr:hypothetical protein [Edaphobacter sp. 12200R-103]QHS52417.1 hypothetical protein GWR55_12290 [Edaphobacter sp. 12200R-103]
MRKRGLIALLLLLVCGLPSQDGNAQAGKPDWQTTLRQELPLLGHRNWILIVDSAYPLQISPGVETVETGEDQLAVTRAVLWAISHSIHVRPLVFLDAELPYVPSSDYANVSAYREGLQKVLKPYTVQSLPHAEILDKVSETAKTYKVLVLKTTMTVPYTSVFLQLDCKYLSADGERKLREAMKAGEKQAH